MSRLAIVAVLAAGAIAVGVGVPVWSNARAKRARVACMDNLKKIGAGMADYWRESDDHWPWMAKIPSDDLHDPAWPGMATVLGGRVAGGAATFHCPGDARTLDASHPLYGRYGGSTTWFETEGTSYEWMLAGTYAGRPVGRERADGRRALGGGAADQPIMHDFGPFHGGAEASGAFHVLYADLKVRPIDYQRSRRGESR